MGGSMGLAQLLQVLAGLGECGVAIAVLVVVRQDLWYALYIGGYYQGDVCYMAPLDTSINVCSYTYWVVGFSFFLSIAIMFAQCFIRQRKSYLLATLGLTLVGTIWWLGYAITATVYGRNANDVMLPYESSRNAAWILGWVNFGLFAAALVLGGLVWGDCLKPPVEPVPQMPYPDGPVAYQQGPYQQGPYQQPYVATGTPVGGAPYYQQPPPYTYSTPPPGAGAPAPPPGYPPAAPPNQFATSTI